MLYQTPSDTKQQALTDKSSSGNISLPKKGKAFRSGGSGSQSSNEVLINCIKKLTSSTDISPVELHQNLFPSIPYTFHSSKNDILGFSKKKKVMELDTDRQSTMPGSTDRYLISSRGRSSPNHVKLGIGSHLFDTIEITGFNRAESQRGKVPANLPKHDSRQDSRKSTIVKSFDSRMSKDRSDRLAKLSNGEYSFRKPDINTHSIYSSSTKSFLYTFGDRENRDDRVKKRKIERTRSDFSENQIMNYLRNPTYQSQQGTLEGYESSHQTSTEEFGSRLDSIQCQNYQYYAKDDEPDRAFGDSTSQVFNDTSTKHTINVTREKSTFLEEGGGSYQEGNFIGNIVSQSSCDYQSSSCPGSSPSYSGEDSRRDERSNFWLKKQLLKKVLEENIIISQDIVSFEVDLFL